LNLESTRPRGRPRNRWQDEVREDGRIVGGEEWREKIYNREEWKKLLRMARNRRILHMPMEWNEPYFLGTPSKRHTFHTVHTNCYGGLLDQQIYSGD
jgi:hypothetical protein